MAVRIGSGLSTGGDVRAAAADAARRAAVRLEGADCDLALVFVSGAHLATPELTLEVVRDTLAPGALTGCGAGGVMACGREIESGTAVSVWAAALDGGWAETFHARVEDVAGGSALIGAPDLAGASAALLLPEPESFPTDGVLDAFTEHAPGVPVLGGLASGRTPDGQGALFLGDEVLTTGAVGVRFEGVEVLPCVSQGAAPLGPELIVTAAEDDVVTELDGRPALAALRDLVADFGVQERQRAASGLLVGIALESPHAGNGTPPDFLIRGLVGADSDTGSVQVGAVVSKGQVLQLHARDAVSADRELTAALALRREALGGGTPAGALVFACNGRGARLFGAPDHDAYAVGSAFAAPVAAAGFFAGGEIGPVGGANHLHGFTATVALFA